MAEAPGFVGFLCDRSLSTGLVVDLPVLMSLVKWKSWCQRWLANHEKDDDMAGWLEVKVEDELAKLNHGDHELGPCFTFVFWVVGS
jgi:hypothetical protein